MGMESWVSRFDLLTHPVSFVTATENSGRHSGTPSCEHTQSQPSLSGNEAKRIYEEILNEKSDSQHACDLSQTKHKSNKRSCNHMETHREEKHIVEQNLTNPLCNKDLFKAAQNGDVDSVKQCLEVHNLCKNATDGYSWTPLMMAAYEGHEELVLYLLAEGAEWSDIIDGSGYDARDLACIRAHTNIANIFTNQRKYVRQWKMRECEKAIAHTIKREKIWCDLCRTYFYASPKSGPPDPHHTSTLHLFNDKERAAPCTSHYHITHANRGFQIMRKGGWDGSSGLGPEGSGQKYPVKTVLKRDRLGFGADGAKSVPRITHFTANDESAIKRHCDTKCTSRGRREVSSKTKRKVNQSKKEAVQKQKEIDFRRSFDSF